MKWQQCDHCCSASFLGSKGTVLEVSLYACLPNTGEQMKHRLIFSPTLLELQDPGIREISLYFIVTQEGNYNSQLQHCLNSWGPWKTAVKMQWQEKLPRTAAWICSTVLLTAVTQIPSCLAFMVNRQRRSGVMKKRMHGYIHEIKQRRNILLSLSHVAILHYIEDAFLFHIREYPSVHSIVPWGKSTSYDA